MSNILPKHYQVGTQYEVFKVLDAWELSNNFYLGNVVKYIARAGKKDATKYVEDLRKAKRYLEYEIERTMDKQLQTSTAIPKPAVTHTPLWPSEKSI